ncbi:MAG TPA: hypothetical protein VIL30_09445 [Ramlibacter sp.]
MARRVEAIVAAMGALCVRKLDALRMPACIALRITAPGGLTAGLCLNGDAGRLHALHFVHWSIEGPSRNRLRPGFGGVDAYRFCKATHVAYSFEAMCAQLELSLRLAATGEAYQLVGHAARQTAEAA